jgi:broad specificity phosphatase PhoE
VHLLAGVSVDHVNKTTNLWLVRHGEPAAEKAVCCVLPNTGLSATGLMQMAEVAAYLEAEPVTAVYCSPLKRALESARLIAAARGCALEVVADLRELDFGEFTGLTFEDISERDPEFCRLWMNSPTGVRFPKGEGFRDMRARVLKSFDAIRRERAGRTSVIVSHAGVNRILIAHALGMPELNLFRLAQDHAAVNLLRFVDDIPYLQLVNHCVGPAAGDDLTGFQPR